VYRVPCIAALLALTLYILPLDKTTAQQSEVSVVIYEAARNKIGLMRYCRHNTPLDPAAADKAIEALEADVRAFPLENKLAREQGDRAEKAGEDGFMEAGRRRDIASFAQLFRTTRADLCKQWAEETLRVQVVRTAAPPVSTATTEPQRASPTIARPVLNTAPPDAAPRAAGLPPLPTKAPLRPPATELTFLQRIMGTGGLGSNPPSSPQITPAPEQPADKARETLFRQRTPYADTALAEKELTAFCHQQQPICRKICNLRFRNDLVGCSQTCDSRVARCVRTGCYKWTDPELLIAEKFGGYQCYR
jgi:hypothetical protein